MEESDHVSVVADWKLEEINGNVFGICEVSFGPPYDSLDIVHTMKMHRPTHSRCALFSLFLAMDLVLTSSLNPVVRHVIFCTKSKWVHDMVSSGKKHSGMLRSIQNKIEKLKTRYNIDFIYIVREIDDENYIKYDELHGKDDDFEGEEKADRLFDAKVSEKGLHQILSSGAKPLRRYKRK
jgi:hypothetical protein